MSANHEKIKNDRRWKLARIHTLTRDDHTCAACGAVEDLTVDHIRSLDSLLKSGGDPFDEDNLRTLCRPCNSRKGNRSMVRTGWTDPAWAEVLGVSLTSAAKPPQSS